MIQRVGTITLEACRRPLITQFLRVPDPALLRRIVDAPLTAMVFAATPPDTIGPAAPDRTRAGECRAFVWLHALAVKLAAAVTRMRQPSPRPADAVATLAANEAHAAQLTAIYIANRGLIAKALSKCGEHAYRDDEHESVANAALFRAIGAFDPLLGLKFSTFAMQCMRNGISQWVRSRGAALRARTNVEGDDTNYANIADLPARCETPVTAAANAEQADAVDAMLDTLRQNHSAVVRDVFGIGRPAMARSEIAASIGITQSRVGQIIQASLRSLRSEASGSSGAL